MKKSGRVFIGRGEGVCSAILGGNGWEIEFECNGVGGVYGEEEVDVNGEGFWEG